MECGAHENLVAPLIAILREPRAANARWRSRSSAAVIACRHENSRASFGARAAEAEEVPNALLGSANSILVLETAGRVAVGLEAVLVDPVRERPLDLPVAPAFPVS